MTKRSHYAFEPVKHGPRALYFDIETEGRDDAALFAPEFKARSNIKDPAKIASDLADKRADWSEKTALSAITGRVLAIGFAIDDQPVEIRHGNEKDSITVLLEKLKLTVNNGGQVFGYNILGFDLPFLAQRAWALGIEVPHALFEFYRGRFSWHSNHVDLMQVWLAGTRDFAGQGLGNVCKLLGIGEKTGHGKDFGSLYKSDLEQAVLYLQTDVELVRKLAKRLNFAPT